MTLRELYNLVTESTIAPDAQVELRDGELCVVAAKAPLPPPPTDTPQTRAPATGGAGWKVGHSK